MENHAEWITERIRDISVRFRERSAGRRAAKECLSAIAEELSAWTDTVEKHRFTFSPNAFVGAFRIAGLSCALAVPTAWLSFFLQNTALEIVNALLYLVGLFSLVFEFVLYKSPVDPFFEKRSSFNVFAVRRARVSSERKLILCAHADAAYEMPIMNNMKPWLLAASLTLGVAAMAAFPFLGTGSVYSCLAQTAILPVWRVFLGFVDLKTVVDGANDDLSGCYVIMSVMKELAQRDFRLENTDICCLITDGEESGLRGAAAFAKERGGELENAIVVAVDTIHDPGEFRVYHRGMNFTQRNSEKVCALLQKAGLACGMEIPKAGFYPGANDADAFSRRGVSAAALCAVRHRPSPYYHYRLDTWRSLDPDALEAARKIIMQLIRLVDGE